MLPSSSSSSSSVSVEVEASSAVSAANDLGLESLLSTSSVELGGMEVLTTAIGAGVAE
jgi:hypothetical protein